MHKKTPRFCKQLLKLSIAALWISALPSLASAEDVKDKSTRTILELPSEEHEVISLIQGAKGLSVHKELYILPLTHADRYQGGQTEIEFQISAKQRILKTNFYFGYTQKSFWQAYDFGNSSVFRETNYNPEIFYRTGIDTVKFGKWKMDIGFEHESNGQGGVTSRSWNRVYVAPYLPRQDSLWYFKFWYRVPVDLGVDDNPDITDFLGYGELHYRHSFNNRHLVHAMIRGNPGTGKGAVSLNYSIPGPSDNYYYLLRLWSGYGESLIDYNRSTNRIGLGFIFAR